MNQRATASKAAKEAITATAGCAALAMFLLGVLWLVVQSLNYPLVAIGELLLAIFVLLFAARFLSERI